MCGVVLEEVGLTAELTSGVRMPWEAKVLLAGVLNSWRRVNAGLDCENAHLDASE